MSTLTLPEPIAAYVVRANCAGNFPDNPIVLSCRFRLERGLIASLEIMA